MIIGFHGVLGSGKDTAGERLAEMVTLPVEQLSFAAKLKESAAALLGIPVEDWERYKNDPDVRILLMDGYVDQEGVVYSDDFGAVEGPNIIRAFTAREFLQRYGTESHRDVFDQDFWVDQALAGAYSGWDTLFYVTDVRFQNEFDGIKKRGGMVARVTNGAEPEIEYDADMNAWLLKGTRERVHWSEVPLQGCDFEIDNSIRYDNFASLDSALSQMLDYLGVPHEVPAWA